MVAYREIKDRILSCAIQPGSIVSELQLARELGFSRTPVREALATLVHEGYVHVRARKSYQVSMITLADVQEVFALRLLLEPAAASLAAGHADAEQLRRLRMLADEAADTLPFGSRDRSFLFALADASGNRRMATMLKLLLDEVYRLHMAGLSFPPGQDDERQHRALLASLLQGNHHLAFDIATLRVETDRRRVMEAMLESMTSGAAPAFGLAFPRSATDARVP